MIENSAKLITSGSIIILYSPLGRANELETRDYWTCVYMLSLHTHIRAVPDRFLLYGLILTNNMSRISMISLDADSNIPVPVPFQVSGLGAYFVAYDHRDHRVYWNEVDPPAIKRAAIDSRDHPEVFITTSIRSVSGECGNVS